MFPMCRWRASGVHRLSVLALLKSRLQVCRCVLSVLALPDGRPQVCIGCLFRLCWKAGYSCALVSFPFWHCPIAGLRRASAVRFGAAEKQASGVPSCAVRFGTTQWQASGVHRLSVLALLKGRLQVCRRCADLFGTARWQASGVHRLSVLALLKSRLQVFRRVLSVFGTARWQALGLHWLSVLALLKSRLQVCQCGFLFVFGVADDATIRQHGNNTMMKQKQYALGFCLSSLSRGCRIQQSTRPTKTATTR
jgi:hypothetical protein